MPVISELNSLEGGTKHSREERATHRAFRSATAFSIWRPKAHKQSVPRGWQGFASAHTSAQVHTRKRTHAARKHARTHLHEKPDVALLHTHLLAN
eukprot:1608781-Rhodomonas_salina.2